MAASRLVFIHVPKYMYFLYSVASYWSRVRVYLHLGEHKIMNRLETAIAAKDFDAGFSVYQEIEVKS